MQITHRWRTRSLLILVALAAAARPAPASGQDRVEVEPLAGSLFLFRAHHGDRFTNQVVSAGSDGLLMVDMDGDWRTMKPHGEQLRLVRDSLAALGQPLRVLINTHWHGDHSGGNEAFGQAAVVVAHENTRELLIRSHRPWWAEDSIPALQRQGRPVVTFGDSLTIHFNGEAVRLWNFGLAHTAGDAVVFFGESRVVHMGDLYHGMDRPSVGGDMVGLAGTLGQTIARIPEDTKVVTGHGAVTDVAELRSYHRLLAEAIDWVRHRASGPQPADSVIAAGAESLAPAAWGEADARQWIGSIWRSVVGDVRPDA